MLLMSLLTTFAAGVLGIIPSFKILPPKFSKSNVASSTKQSVPVAKSQDVITEANNHLIPHANIIVSFSTKTDDTTLSTRDPVKLPHYDYAEPEEIHKKLEEASKINSTQHVAKLKQPVTTAPQIDTLGGRRKWNNLETQHPGKKRVWRAKHNHIKRSQNSNKLRQQNKNEVMYYRAALTKPNKYEIKRYKKSRIHGRRHQRRHHKQHHKHVRRFGKLKTHRLRNNDLGHHLSRKQNAQPINPPVKSIEVTTPPDLASTLTMQPNKTTAEVITLQRAHIHPKQETTQRVATRPSLYGITTETTSTAFEPVWVQPNKSTKKDSASAAQQEDHEARNSLLSSDSDSEADILGMKNKVERFVEYLNEDRNDLVKDKKRGKAKRMRSEEYNGILRLGEKIKSQPLLDLSPAKSHKIEVMRKHGRICQRNVMIPEGPKYNSRGQTYMPEFKKVEGAPDYPKTKKPSFIIPACCNCCKKSVLGCQ
ncbi:hypothetical protein O0L34_g18943 [Tuta absoluta]|nr:hypothetical protein O0L34_g18943 [Tuta absoluta]